MHRPASILSILLLVAAVAGADVVHLVSGGRIEGIVRRVGDQVHVDALAGSTHVPAAAVERIDEAHRSPIEIYLENDETVRKTPTLEGHLDLAVWLMENGGRRFLADHMEAALTFVRASHDPGAVRDIAERYQESLGDELRQIWEHVLSLAPNDEHVRRALHYHMLGGQWVTDEEWNVARGLVLFEGDWVETEVRDLILRERAAKLDRRIREVELRERKIVRREKAVEDGKRANALEEKKLDRRARELAVVAHDLDEKERDVERRERILDGLIFCRTCRGYFLRDHVCPGLWTFCPRCRGYFQGGHRCPR